MAHDQKDGEDHRTYKQNLNSNVRKESTNEWLFFGPVRRHVDAAIRAILILRLGEATFWAINHRQAIDLPVARLDLKTDRPRLASEAGIELYLNRICSKLLNYKSTSNKN